MKGEKQENAFILPEMLEDRMRDPQETLAQSEWMEEQMHQVAVSYRASRTKMERAVQESDKMQMKLLQEFNDIVEWMLENGTETVRRQMLEMPDLLYQERELRNNVLRAWYAHIDVDREVQKTQKELQKLHSHRLANLEYKDDYLQEKIEGKQHLSSELLEEKWQEEQDEKHGYRTKKKRLEQTLEYALHTRVITDKQMQQALDQVNELWITIRGKVGELAEEISRTPDIDGEKEAERIYSFVMQEMETLKKAEEAWKKHKNTDHDAECTHAEKATTDEQDLRWMEHIYNCSQEEARNL